MHRQLEAALKCHNDTWYEALPAVLMGMRAALKEDIGTSPVELTFGEPMRLSGEYLSPSPDMRPASQLVKALRQKIQSLSPHQPSTHDTRPTFVSKDLNTASYVFVRTNRTDSGYQYPYTGPYPVIERGNKAYKLLIQ
uniref:Uncharacterized protein n=1 Tax=Bracon brevicornis TaxID=1563983 RepID=A0A6V7KPL7_9HYME